MYSARTLPFWSRDMYLAKVAVLEMKTLSAMLAGITEDVGHRSGVDVSRDG